MRVDHGEAGFFEAVESGVFVFLEIRVKISETYAWKYYIMVGLQNSLLTFQPLEVC